MKKSDKLVHPYPLSFPENKIATFSNFVNTLLDVAQKRQKGSPVFQETAFLIPFC